MSGILSLALPDAELCCFHISDNPPQFQPTIDCLVTKQTEVVSVLLWLPLLLKTGLGYVNGKD